MTALQSEPSAMRRARVLLPLPLSGPYDYAVPDLLTLTPGNYVRVPLGNRQIVGVVWDSGDTAVAPPRLKEIGDVLDLPPLPEVTRRFVDWVARYTVSPPGAVLRMAMRAPEGFHAPLVRQGVRATGLMPSPMTPARARVLAAAKVPLAPRDLAAAAGVSAGVIRDLLSRGALAAVDLPAEPPPVPLADPDRPGLPLNPAQADAAAALVSAVGDQRFAALLLDGVTGSGKTEVYFEAIAAALRAGGQALILLPEIALTVQFLERFAARFGARPIEWHSDLTARERRDAWRAVNDGRARVVVGARSALFLPFPNLKLIVVDEEHERAFKQEDGVIYHARDMAVVRAKLCDHPIVLASATPSLESLVNAELGRYTRLVLPSRAGSAPLPSIAAIDLRLDPPGRGRWIAPSLVTAVTETLDAGEQALLFLNRRGYAPLTLCRRCGHRFACPHCQAWLVEHRYRQRLTCHHCAYEQPLPLTCPACAATGTLAPCGPGVERIAEEAATLFPSARLTVLSSDSLTGPRALEAALAAITQGAVDLVIGTQLVAKGHNFPKLTLVGVIDADLGLEGGDLRAAERTFQLVTQVSGRAGRAERPGRALIQTYAPEHPVMRALVAGERTRFNMREAEARQRLNLPPYGKLAALIISGAHEERVDATARALAAAAPQRPDVEVLGPAPAPLALLRGRFRRRFLVKAERGTDLSALIARWVATVRVPTGVRVAIDIDPYSFL